ncbi:sensor histidine kinase [Nonomuraea fuscirosea]|uniref:sensor histidine kinase n=1 Tax=Nonomuraea fuscirosea TaxID=1291556 RepID=UPI0033EC29AC
MRQPRSMRELERWVGFSDGRAPIVFSVLFWAAAGICAVVLAGALPMIDQVPPGDRALYAVISWTGAGALLLAAVLWPLLPWRREASVARRAASVAFLVVSLPLLSPGGASAPIIVGLAVGNALVVFGLRGALTYTAVAGLLGFGISAVNPRQTLVGAAVNGTLMLLLCLVLLLVVIAMFQSHSRAEETRRLLSDLEQAHSDLEQAHADLERAHGDLGQAHAELERHAARSRELAVAEERARMARDMHDSVGHYLTVINVGLQNAQRYRAVRPEAAWDEVSQARELTLEALTDTRRWVRALKPLRMDGLHGPAALRVLTESFGSDDTGVAFTMTGTWPDVDENRELVCYRVVQEGLTNALRHSRARHIEVALDCTRDRVEVTVTDDGRGAAPGATENGFGLRGLRERLHGVGGALDVAGHAGEGFTLKATVPL